MGFRQALEKTLMLLTAAAFVYVFSYSTSPRYEFLGGDSSIFQTVGKLWAQGFLPYVDAFEHKGPLLFLINAVGYEIFPRAGLIVPQIFCLYVAIFFAWRTMNLYSSSKWRIFFLALTLIFYAAHYQEGNHVEEYSVAFVTIAAYFFLRGLKENFSPTVGFVHGICFGACAMIRLSDAAQICCQIFLLGIFLLRDGEIKLLRKNLLNFVVGAAIAILPFVVYFAAHGALYEMIFGTFLFNMKYTALTPQKFLTEEYFMFFGVHFMPLFVLLATSIFVRGRLKICGLFMSAAMLAMLLNFRLFRHYALMIFPLMPILFAVLCELWPTVKNFFLHKKNLPQKICHVAISILMLVIFSVFALYVVPFSMYATLDGVAEIQRQDLLGRLFLTTEKIYAADDLTGDEKFLPVEDLARLIPENERDSFVTWGFYCTMPHWVLLTGIKSRERLFFLNYTFTKIDPNFRREWFGNVRKNFPRWILCGYGFERDDAELEQLLAEKYSPAGETFIFPQILRLYRLKQ